MATAKQKKAKAKKTRLNQKAVKERKYQAAVQRDGGSRLAKRGGASGGAGGNG